MRISDISSVGGFPRHRLKAMASALFLLLAVASASDTLYSAANHRDQILSDGNKQISDINLLLPISNCADCRKVTYQISAVNGCFNWQYKPTYSNSMQGGLQPFVDLDKPHSCARVPSMHEHCRSEADLNQGFQVADLDYCQGYKQSFATHQHLFCLDQKQTLRCETKLAKIAKIEIQTHLRQIYVDNYEHLKIAVHIHFLQLPLQAYDEQGNLFNSLQGLSFDWNIEEGDTNLKMVTMKEAAHNKFSGIEKEMEDSKFLKGLKTGFALISVRINEPGYEEVLPASVRLTVTEPFIIMPSHTVYLLPTSAYKFHLAKINFAGNEMRYRNISLPSRQYQWNVDAPIKGEIGEDGVFISKDLEGFVNIQVVDQLIVNNTAEAQVKVVFPSYLDLEIADVTTQMIEEKPFLERQLSNPFKDQLGVKEWENNWVLIEDHYYLVKMFVYDRDRNLIDLTENLVFQRLFDSEFFDVITVNSIESEFVVRAKKATPKDLKLNVVGWLNEVKSTYGITYNVDRNKLRAEREVKITKPVMINHPTDLVLLPFIRNIDENKSGELWHLTAEGGSGYYQWSIEDQNIASISAAGTIRSRQIGRTVITVKDNINVRNKASLDLEVSSVAALTWLEDHLEIEKKNEIATLNIIALDRQSRKFTNCTAVHTQFEMKAEGILSPTQSVQDYDQLTAFVQNNKPLMFLKQTFDENPHLMTVSDATKREGYSPERETVLLHNNFGICSQQKISAIGEGLARARAFFSNQEDGTSTKLIESNYAEIAAYNKLTTLTPNFSTFFSDLQTYGQMVSEDQNFNTFVQDGAFSLTFGSSAIWTIQGGTNFWKDLADKYQIRYSEVLTNPEQGNLSRDLISLEKVSETTTLFKYVFACNNPRDHSKLSRPHRFKVNMSQQNLQSKYLLRPAVHAITIDINCEPPHSQKLYWTQEEKTLSPVQLKRLPRSKLISGEKTHYVLVNSNHQIRSLVFDTSNFVFFNHSSIANQVVSSNEHMLEIEPVQDSFKQAVANNVYDKRWVQAFNITGTAYIHATAQGYYRAFLNKDWQHKGILGKLGLMIHTDEVEQLHLHHLIKDSMRVEIVRNVDIQPKYKSVYISNKGNQFQFHIHHGSGHFAVNLNDTDLAEMHMKEGIVTIYPKKQGSLEIKVEDVEIPDSQFAVAEILISDIARLDLDAPGSLIEQGSSLDLYITAIDNYGVEFDADQYEFMDFNIEIEMTGVMRQKGLTADQDPNNNRNFTLRGYQPAIYHVTAYSSKYRPAVNYYKQEHLVQERLRVTSEMMKVEVFPLLEIQPSNLLLTPLMRYTLQIVGGPSRSPSNLKYQGGTVEIRFDIEDKSVATVDSFREVTGQEVGDTRLFYEIIQLNQGPSGTERRSIISKKMVPIRVRLVTSIEVPQNNQRLVYSGSMIKLIGILKFNQETFTHGIAPISYNWNCSNPNILQLQYPSKSDIAQTQGLSSTLIMASKKIRDNEHNNDNSVFFTAFNSSSMYSLGIKQGEAMVSLQLAIEYPDKYRHEKNIFQTQNMLRVNQKLTVAVPEYINNQDKQTHLYLMPPNTYSKIETNRKTRLRLGYSQQSVYDYSTHTYQYVDTQTPIIQLINDEGIRTYDKYGKVTVIIEENQAFSDQVVMLNVLITDIYNLASKDVYSALSLPLGSSIQIPIKFQNEHAHSFAQNIEGISVGIQLSHPRVVSPQLDNYNQTLTLQAQGSGECNIVVYLIDHPHIYDVFKVRVSSVVKPTSPVQIHVGGQVTFKIMDASEFPQSKEGAVWSSNNPGVLDINQKTGQARGLQEGRADVLLSNHISAASIVQVSKVKHAEIDERSRKNLILNTDDSAHDSRIRIKLYLHDQLEELTPTVQFDGITLIKQNVGIKCETDYPSLVEARSEVSELEGFFCILNYVSQSNQRSIPKQVKVTVTVFASNPTDPTGKIDLIYKEQVLQFDLALISNIKVESLYRNGISLNKEHRTAEIKIFSNVQFNVQAVNLNDADKSYDLIRFRVNKSSDVTNEYYLTVTVPREITHSFQSQLILTHPLTGQKTVLPIHFSDAMGDVRQYRYSQPEAPSAGASEGFMSGLKSIFGGQTTEQQKQKTTTGDRHLPEEKPTFMNYLLIGSFTLVVLSFFMVNLFQLDPHDIFRDIMEGNWPFRRRRVYPSASQRRPTFVSRDPIYSRPPQIRDPLVKNLFSSAMDQHRQSPQVQTPSRYQGAPGDFGGSVRPVNLQDYNYSAESQRRRKIPPSEQSSIYDHQRNFA